MVDEMRRKMQFVLRFYYFLRLHFYPHLRIWRDIACRDQTLTISALDSCKKVSYKWVSKEYGICLNSAKRSISARSHFSYFLCIPPDYCRILGLFADKYRTQPLAVYYQIYGISSDTGYIECKFIEKFDLESKNHICGYSV